MTAIWAWIHSHPTLISLVLYHIASAFVGSLEMPDASSGKFYRFFFRFVNRFAANWSRAQASSVINAGETPQRSNP